MCKKHASDEGTLLLLLRRGLSARLCENGPMGPKRKKRDAIREVTGKLGLVRSRMALIRPSRTAQAYTPVPTDKLSP